MQFCPLGCRKNIRLDVNVVFVTRVPGILVDVVRSDIIVSSVLFVVSLDLEGAEIVQMPSH